MMRSHPYTSTLALLPKDGEAILTDYTAAAIINLFLLPVSSYGGC